MKKEEEEPDYNPDEEEIKEMKEKLEKEREDDEFPVTEEEVNIALGKQPEKTEEEKLMEDFQNDHMNKLLFTVFHDKNTFVKEFTTCKTD